MAKIYDFELKSIKASNGMIQANLYYENKKIALYTDDNAGANLKFEDKIDINTKNIIFDEAKSYFKAYPRELYSNHDEDIVLELIEELYRLKELETIFKKVNKKEKAVVLELKFSKRERYITDYIKDDICLSTTKWDKEFEEKMLEKYKPVEYTCLLYTSDAADD